MFINSKSLHHTFVDSRIQKNSKESSSKKASMFPFSFWQNNSFVGSSPAKAYGGYYKAKSKKMYQKQRQKLKKNSTQYIKRVDQSIEVEKQRRSILRPNSFHNKKSILGKELNQVLKTHQMSHSCEFGNDEKANRAQSELKLNDYQQNMSANKEKKATHFGLVRRCLVNSSDTVSFIVNGKLS